MSTAIDIGTLITRTPGIHGGCPHIAGTGVTVRRIASWYKLGLTAEEIAARIGHLTLAQVYAALTYYHANREEIEEDLAQEEAEAKSIEAKHARRARTPARAISACISTKTAWIKRLSQPYAPAVSMLPQY